MAAATFVLAVIGAITGVVSLAWNVRSFVLQGARPELTPIVGFLSTAGGSAGLVYRDATEDMRQSLASAMSQMAPGPLVIGVKVVNDGRAPFHVASWALRSDPSATSLIQFEAAPGSATVSCDIPLGASKIFYTELNSAYALAAAGSTVDGKRQRVSSR